MLHRHVNAEYWPTKHGININNSVRRAYRVAWRRACMAQLVLCMYSVPRQHQMKRNGEEAKNIKQPCNIESERNKIIENSSKAKQWQWRGIMKISMAAESSIKHQRGENIIGERRRNQ